MSTGIKTYKGRYSGKQIDDLLDKIPDLASRVEQVEQGSGDKTEVITVGSASREWVINHNMNKYPSVTVITSYGEVVETEIVYDSLSRLRVILAFSVSGKVILN